jgi:hypothetical protein
VGVADKAVAAEAWHKVIVVFVEGAGGAGTTVITVVAEFEQLFPSVPVTV